ncbi:MAG: hypothetical protein VX335_02500 [Pseudomonadota bacterium]|nr:hypothetical protein [Pseudomonadota bacterium]
MINKIKSALLFGNIIAGVVLLITGSIFTLNIVPLIMGASIAVLLADFLLEKSENKNDKYNLHLFCIAIVSLFILTAFSGLALMLVLPNVEIGIFVLMIGFGILFGFIGIIGKSNNQNLSNTVAPNNGNNEVFPQAVAVTGKPITAVHVTNNKDLDETTCVHAQIVSPGKKGSVTPSAPPLSDLYSAPSKKVVKPSAPLL